jgi:hypothetical protein
MLLDLTMRFEYLRPYEIDDLMRCGPDHDGGYVVSKSNIRNCNFILGLGLSDDWGFEDDFSKLRRGVEIHVYDHTVSPFKYLIKIIKGILNIFRGRPDIGHVRLKYNALIGYLRYFPSRAQHFRKMIVRNPVRIGEASLTQAIHNTKAQSLFLKIDIEGSEYEIIQQIIDNERAIHGLVIEFHDTEVRREEFKAAIDALDKKFDLIHIHANNFAELAEDNLPTVLEISFIKRVQNRNRVKRIIFPNDNLDSANNPFAPDYSMYFN